MIILNPCDKNAEQKTVIVFGAARGGTSAAFGLLRILGVQCLPETHPLKHESSPVHYSGNRVDAEATRKTIESMDRKGDVWGWKSPRDLYALGEYRHLLRNPHFVIVTRSLADVIGSAVAYDVTEARSLAHHYSDYHAELARFLAFEYRPAAVFSYEAAVVSPERLIGELGAWLDIKVDDFARADAKRFLDKADRGYKPMFGNEAIEFSEEELSRDRLVSNHSTLRLLTRQVKLRESNLQRDSVEAESICYRLRDELTSRINERFAQLGLKAQPIDAEMASYLDRNALCKMLALPACIGVENGERLSESVTDSSVAALAAEASRAFSEVWRIYKAACLRREELQAQIESLQAKLGLVASALKQA